MKNENSKEESISAGNIKEEEKMLYNLEDNEEHINLSDINQKTKSDIEPLYVMTLELSRGKNEQIKIYSNSNPAELAFNFCKANNLDLSALTYLKEEIDKLMFKKPINQQEEDNQNQCDQSNALSRESNRSSNLQTSKLLNANIQKHLEGDDISSINKNNSQNSKEDNSLSESLFNNIISSSTKFMNNAHKKVQDNQNSFSFTTANQKKSASTFSRISQTRKYKQRESHKERERERRDKNRPHKPVIKKHILPMNSNNNNTNPFVNISQSSTRQENKNNSKLINRCKDKGKSQQKEITHHEAFKSYCPSNNQLKNKYLAKHIEEMKTETKKMFTFRPQINNTKLIQSQLTFIQRQEHYSSLVKKKTHNLSNLLYSNEDDPLFRPKLISNQRRGNANLRHQNGKSVFDKNFDYAIKYKKNKELYSNQYYNDITKKANPIPESNKIVSQLYIDSFKKIFSKMDLDNDGMITSYNYSVKQLPNEIAKVIQPIINEMKSSNHQLNQNEFIFIMNYLCTYNQLSLEDKKTILDYNKRVQRISSADRTLNNNKHFDLQINTKSRKLAVQHQRKMIRSLSAKNIISERPSRQISKEKYFINQSTATTERKMSSK